VQTVVESSGGWVEWLTTVVHMATKSGSLLVPQLCVRRQGTPSRSKMVRIWLRFTKRWRGGPGVHA
jgi:hypothetical protein